MSIRKIRLLVVVSGLPAAGAELMLLRLLKHMDRQRFEVQVVSLSSLGKVGPMMQAEGISVEALGMGGLFSMLAKFPLLWWKMRIFRPDVVQTWMYHADFLGGLAARLQGIRRVVWSIRNSNLDPASTKRSTLAVVRASSVVSGWVPQTIVSCSEVARQIHVAQGYCAEKFCVIPNGFELDRFKPDARARAAMRVELGVQESALVVGVAGRYHPQKNHLGFVEAAARVAQQMPEVCFVMAGLDVDESNAELVRAIQSAGLSRRVRLLGRRADMPVVMAGLDVLVSASAFGEAFPNVLGEAMACGVPCVATDVGDSAFIVGDTGTIVEVGDLSGLAAAVIDMLRAPVHVRQERSRAARNRVEAMFSIGAVVSLYERLYEDLLGRERCGE